MLHYSPIALLPVPDIQPLLLKNAELNGHRIDVRCRDGQITEIGQNLKSVTDEIQKDVEGGALLPGLRDDHLHLMASAARRRSVHCGPPDVTSTQALELALQNAPSGNWVRGTGYHESVAGDLTKTQIDQWVSDRPVRIQHRSGRLWYFNTKGAAELGLPLDGDGQLYRQDEALLTRLPSVDDLASDLQAISMELASYGVTRVNDATPSNDDDSVALLRKNCFRQYVDAMGCEQLSEGHLKIMLDDYQLPDLDELAERIAGAHARGRPVAIHCVSRVEIVFALAAISEAGMAEGDRLEHATELQQDLIEQVAALRLMVVPNPNFIYARGDQYIADNETDVLDSLYPIRSIDAHHVRCTAGTDAPFGDLDPWIAIRAATNRRTKDGLQINASESVSPERAVGLFTCGAGANSTFGSGIRNGQVADFCVLDRPWSEARTRLASEDVLMTVRSGVPTYQRA